MPRRNAVVIVADDLQFPPAALLAARLQQLNPRPDTDIILASDVPAMLADAKAAVPGVELLDLSEIAKRERLPTRSYFTRATYLRLFLAGLLRRSHARILYLDADIYAESAGVFRLFDLDMAGHAIAAVRDLTVPFFLNRHNLAELEATLKASGQAPTGEKYLNAGVLLIDADDFAARRIERKTMAILKRMEVAPQLADQSLLNTVLAGDWLELSPSFNMITRAWQSSIRAFAPPVIVHFTGQVKPWRWGFALDHPVRAELLAFVKQSPWPDFIRRANPLPIGQGASLPQREPDRPIWFGPSLEALLRHLRETPFTDVAQGLTVLHPEALQTPPA